LRVPAGRKDHLNGAIEQGEMPFRGPKLFLHDSTSIAGVWGPSFSRMDCERS
jgi:hypothetical protein